MFDEFLYKMLKWLLHIIFEQIFIRTHATVSQSGVYEVDLHTTLHAIYTYYFVFLWEFTELLVSTQSLYVASAGILVLDAAGESRMGLNIWCGASTNSYNKLLPHTGFLWETYWHSIKHIKFVVILPIHTYQHLASHWKSFHSEKVFLIKTHPIFLIDYVY